MIFTSIRRPLALLLCLSFLATSCAGPMVNRKPSSEEWEKLEALSKGEFRSLFEIPKDLLAATSKFYEFIQSESFTPTSCGPFLNEVYKKAFQLDSSYFDTAKAVEDSEKIVTNVWLSRLYLRKKMKEWHAEDQLNYECANSMRNVMRAGRFMEDYVAELYAKPGPVPKDKKDYRKAFVGNFPYLLTNPEMGKFELKSGDLLLSRGNAYTSAAIARIGDIDAQFSHLAILYIDEKTKEKFVVEAHIEVGSIVVPFETYISDGKARAVVFRQANATLAHLAAKRMYDLVKKASDSGRNIPYDFGMHMSDHSELFCSEVGSYAYEMASKELGENLMIPLFPTWITMKNRKFLEDIGVLVNQTFAPADMEVEPRFELVAEWRDLARMRDNNLQDSILTAMYEWMEREEYIMHGDPLTWLKKNIFWHLRRWPLFSDLLKDRFPLNMKKSALGTMLKLNDISEALYVHLEKKDNAYKQKTGFRMAPKQMLEVLEAYRIEDLARYEKYMEWQRNEYAKSPEDRTHPPEQAHFHNDFRKED